MGRSKLKKKKLQQEEESTEEPTSTKVPIDNLPKEFLWMHVKSGTKIRKVLDYALKEFSSHNSIVWTGIGQGIAKTISCAELFKRKHEGLHQVTKLSYSESESPKKDTTETQRIPEIHILLTKDIKDTTELGYQAPGDCGDFPEKEDILESKSTENVGNVLQCSDTEQSVIKRLIGQKRNNKWIDNAKLSSKRSKKNLS